jgi:hypothetical protein
MPLQRSLAAHLAIEALMCLRQRQRQWQHCPAQLSTAAQHGSASPHASTRRRQAVSHGSPAAMVLKQSSSALCPSLASFKPLLVCGSRCSHPTPQCEPSDSSNGGSPCGPERMRAKQRERG